MDVTTQHCQVPVARYRCGLHDVEPALEQATDGLVSKVVEVQLGHACPRRSLGKCLLDGLGGHSLEDAADSWPASLKNGYRGSAEGHASAMPVLRCASMEASDLAFKVNVLPVQADYLPLTHSRLDSQLHAVQEEAATGRTACHQQPSLLPGV